MNNDEQDKCLESMQSDVQEIKDALLGTFEKKGFISRVRGLERIVKYQWGGFIFIVTTVTGTFIKGLMG